MKLIIERAKISPLQKKKILTTLKCILFVLIAQSLLNYIIFKAMPACKYEGDMCIFKLYEYSIKHPYSDAIPDIVSLSILFLYLSGTYIMQYNTLPSPGMMV